MNKKFKPKFNDYPSKYQNSQFSKLRSRQICQTEEILDSYDHCRIIKERSKSQDGIRKAHQTILSLMQQNSELKNNNYRQQKEISMLKIKINEKDLQIKEIKNQMKKFKAKKTVSEKIKQQQYDKISNKHTFKETKASLSQQKISFLKQFKQSSQFFPDFSVKLTENQEDTNYQTMSKPIYSTAKQKNNQTLFASFGKLSGLYSNSLKLANDKLNKRSPMQQNIECQSLLFLEHSKMARSRIQKLIKQHRSNKSQKCMYQSLQKQ